MAPWEFGRGRWDWIQCTIRDELERVLGAALEALDDRSREIVTRYFGWGDDDPIPLEQIGEAVGLSRERVRQIRNEALRAMRG